MIPINTIATSPNEHLVHTGNTMITKDDANVLVESTGVASSTMNTSSRSNKNNMSMSFAEDSAPANSILKVSKTSAFHNNVPGSYHAANHQFVMMQQEQPVSQQHMMIMQQPNGQADYMFNPAAQQNNMSGMVMMPASAFAQMQTMNTNSAPMPQQVTRQPQQQQVLDPKKAKKFPMKLMLLLCKDEYDHILNWNEQGDRFTIHDPKKFCEDILPKYFKASKFPSFLRKLYRWGFVKRPQSKGSGKEVLTYFHPKFQKGDFKLCEGISCNNGGVNALESMKYFVENASNNASSNNMNALYAATMYPQNSFQSMGANYYMAMPTNNVPQSMNENSQFYSSGSSMASSLADNSAHSSNGNFYSTANSGGGFHPPQQQYQNYNHNGM